MKAAPRVELLWWSGCPSHKTARAMLEEAMTGLGLDPAGIETVQVVTDADAARERFTGSPTIRVDGRDIEPPEEDASPALACRVYFRQDGRPSPLPDPAQVRHALEQALDHA
ncbi:hypothetical protein [Streptomyces sp. NPDC096132]|uniref:DF family (seleno)protein n=1 Tax=Streptomyces sp. NPDC096132 TaxID=3366075 RepID=UPI0037F3EFB5